MMTKLMKIAALGLSAFATVAAANPAAGAASGNSAATASAATASESATRSGQAAASADKKKYCVALEPISGSRMGKRSCKTKAEWAEEGVEVGAKN
jgi:hypothetical protein